MTPNGCAFDYESMRLPASVLDINMKSHQQELRKVHDIPNYNPELYRTERVFFTVRDGTKVPVSLLMKKVRSWTAQRHY